MSSRLCSLVLAAFVGITLGLAAPASAQDEGPMQVGQQSQSAPEQAAAQNPPAPGSPATPLAVPAAVVPATPTAAPDAKAQVRIPSGTVLPLVLHNGISTRSAKLGDPVYFETLFPVMVDGKVAIPAGSYVSGEVTESVRPGRVKGRGELMIKLNTLILPNAYMVNLNATPKDASTGGNEAVDSEGKIRGDSDKASDIGKIAETTAAGAGIGSIATRTGTGAAIGAGAGAAAGLIAVLLTRGPEAEMPRGTTVNVSLNRPILLDSDKDQFATPGQASTLAGPGNREPVRTKNIPF
jgi:hypothetical protein